jgi:hypothetical protein
MRKSGKPGWWESMKQRFRGRNSASEDAVALPSRLGCEIRGAVSVRVPPCLLHRSLSPHRARIDHIILSCPGAFKAALSPLVRAGALQSGAHGGGSEALPPTRTGAALVGDEARADAG